GRRIGVFLHACIVGLAPINVLEAAWRSAEELFDVVEELRPGRLVLAEEMVAAGEEFEACTRDERGEHARLLHWNTDLVTGVQHQGRRLHLACRPPDRDRGPPPHPPR